MRSLQGVHWLRTAGLGVVLACVGFSYALATAGSRGLPQGPQVDSRLLTSTCSRPPTQFVTDRNLGVVVAGSQFARQIIVRFGFKPHRFFFGSILPVNPSIMISESGLITGALDVAAPVKETFEVRVQDSFGDAPPVQRVFDLDFVLFNKDPALGLQFVNLARLPVGVANEPYNFSLHANGGTPPYVFSLKDDLAVTNFPAGLALSPDGVISGKPIIPKVDYSFTIEVEDALRTRVERIFTLTIQPGTISSDFVATSGNFKLNFGRDGNLDSVKLKIVINKTDLALAGVRTVEDLAGVPFDMRFGGVVLPPSLIEVDATGVPTGGGTLPRTFDRNGRISFPSLGNPPAKGENITYNVNLNPRTGQLKVAFGGLDMIETLNANLRTFQNPLIPVSIRIGTPAARPEDTPPPEAQALEVNLDKTDNISFDYRRRGSVGNGTARANDRRPPGGLFLITKVKGSERISPGANNQDVLTFQISGFMREPGGNPVVFGPDDTVGLLFGDFCVGDFPASSFKRSGDVLTFVNTDSGAAALHTIVIDNGRGTVKITTYGMNPRFIFGQDILEAGKPFLLPITLTITNKNSPNPDVPAFDGQSTVALFRKGLQIRNK